MELIVVSGEEFINIYDEKTYPKCPQVTFPSTTTIPLPVALAIAEKVFSDDYEVIEEKERENYESKIKTIKINFEVIRCHNTRPATEFKKTVIAEVIHHEEYNDFLVLNVSL